MQPKKFLAAFIAIYFLIFLITDAIPINTDEYEIFLVVKDMVKNPSYFSLSGNGHRVLHKLIYLSVFWLNDFNPEKVYYPALLITLFFNLLLFVFMYKLLIKLFNYRIALISIFLLATTHTFVRNTWFWTSTNLNLSITFAIIALLFLTKNNSAKNYFMASMFFLLSALSRESMIIPLGLIALASLLYEQRYKKIKYYAISLWPFALYAVFLAFNKIKLGAILRPYNAGFLNPSLKNLANLIFYTDYLIKTLLILPIIFAIFFAIFYRKKYFEKAKKISIGHLSLFLWIVGGIIVLIIPTNTDHRYLIGILPPIFILVAKIIDDSLFTKNEQIFDKFMKLLLGNVFLWLFIFSAAIIHQTGTDYSTITFIANLIFYALIVHSIIIPIKFFKENLFKNGGKTFAFCLLFLSFTLLSFTQLGMSYYFYSFQHDITKNVNNAVWFIAKNAPNKSTVIVNPWDQMTSFDTNWLLSANREDINIIYIENKNQINLQANLTNTTFFVGTPTTRTSIDLITPFIYQHKQNFTLAKQFGDKMQKYPLIRIPNDANKMIQNILTTSILFKIEPMKEYLVLIFEQKKQQ